MLAFGFCTTNNYSAGYIILCICFTTGMNSIKVQININNTMY